jgi:hypothetical protein
MLAGKLVADALSYFPHGLVNIHVIEVELKYEHICRVSRLGKQIAIVALTGLEKL